MSDMTRKIVEYAYRYKIFTLRELYHDLKVKPEAEGTIRSILRRLCISNILHRYEPGIYGYKNECINGSIAPSYEEMIKHVYLKDNNGYISGLEFAAHIGLVEWKPGNIEIVSNDVKRKQTKGNMIFKSPKTTITRKNKCYLQLLDLFDCIDKYYDKSEVSRKILYDQICKLDFKYLLYLACKYYKTNVVNQILELLVKEYSN